MASSVSQKNYPPEEEKICWVCFATEDDDREAPWVKPCRCRGTNKWVHQMCLQRWIDEKQRGNSTAKVSCPQCNTEYLIVFPRLGPLVYFMDLADRITFKVCPFVAGGIFLGSMYWTAVTYGAVTVMQEGLNVMEKADPLFLLIGLPTIPVMLILGETGLHRIPADTTPLTDPISATRVLCGALIMPTIATIFGKLLFGRVNSNFQRTLLGGIAFIAIKGVLRIYFKQQQYIRQAQRKILNFEEHQQVQSQGAAPPTTTQ
ncbi:hypothetical protein LSH36_39g02067 [Paralvinella palmiformis]|uniref:E3 ubiquitin-protein ligase MARCHF5 n=1 Tax=Paralvinella palmiformis TaxID=53620 RepID=A0AAD9K7X0_9ANNE|nr:hypothetical protein LSH36_39g02067 [Paralvinella palmiformis]